jgi:hypothetical protein
MPVETVAFLPSVQESIMDELRTTEGMIFRDEGAKKLFLDIKSFVLEELLRIWKIFDKETYVSILDSYVFWDKSVASKEVARASSAVYADMCDRLTAVTVLYAKYIYARVNAPDVSVSIRKPRIESLLKGMFTRLARTHHVRNGSFYDLDPLRQDFVVRDIFRQTLGTDCIEVVNDTATGPTPTSQSQPEPTDQPEAAQDDEVYPDDSISMVMQRLLPQNPPSPPVHREKSEILQETLKDESEIVEEKETKEEIVEEVKLKTPIEQSVVSAKSVASKVTRVSQFREPTLIRRVTITEGIEGSDQNNS